MQKSSKATEIIPRTGARELQPPSYVTVSFCGVTVQALQRTKAQRKRRIEESVRAMTNLARVLSKPGVKLILDESQPSYVADKRDPSLVIRTLAGESRKGRFSIDGRFIDVE